ncbi:hypothetical protein H257_16514 [Aphanomyces astaci]|uniref:FYVE-type domain-containing protein n=5 Tax=Aphanomyces astaci TaxID=112090 RepID=W4FKB6_APHAT|nr:hypothetical protein H257_16514 [Aphanomyces astaci]ETV67279.1 hypothetical protein H257_16514 [Aphanomyces astaci]RHY07684.1 hypothetical protein DYB25_000561 [Aphanomyces astaci]RHY59345.1 hypothetical protein DYB34_006866 [Aphanomyces astaci]RHY65400.1 hypothetical protein DYB30_003143 [Aphanomyces astaci]RHZ01555.1 hypothetical protein DYB31_001860 [Aphanomyces astaci]|eukprot:XP_009843267.1 hypothetical protein H257_16514 [Aphanomyces astaci]
MSTALPLPKGYFDMSRITEAERDQYTEYASSAIRKVFALSDHHKNSWVPVMEKKGVSIYRNFSNVPKPRSNSTTAPSSSSQSYAHKSNIAEVGCKSTLQASLDEICRAYSAHDDGLFRRLMRKLNPRVVDAAVLQNVVPRTPQRPYRYVGIKWFAVKSASMMVTNRDYCCLEVMDRIVDSHGNDMFVRVLSSIDIPECPSLENSHGFVRGRILAGYIYRMDSMETKVARLHHVARFDPNGYCPTQLSYKIAEKDVVTSMVQLKRVVEKQQMTSCLLLDKAQWVPSTSRSSCTVCGRAFGLFRHRHHCRACGEVICGKCSIQRPIEVPGTNLKKVRICTLCNMGVNKGPDPDAMQELSMLSVNSGATQAYNEMNMYDLYNANGPSTPSAYSSASNGSNISNVSYRSNATDYQRPAPLPAPAPVPMARNPSWGRSMSQESMQAAGGRSQLPVDLSYLPKTPTTPSSCTHRRHSAAATPKQSVVTPRTQAKLDLSYLPQTPKTPRGPNWNSGPTTPETPNRLAPPCFPTTPNHSTVNAPSPRAPPTIAPAKPRPTTYFGEGSLNFGKPSTSSYVPDPVRAGPSVEVAKSIEDMLRKSYSGVAVDYVYNMLGDRTQPAALTPRNAVSTQAT